MNKDQIECLKKSIIHWKENEELEKQGKGIECGVNECACCVKYFGKAIHVIRCYGCPISEYTGRETCLGSPYDSITTELIKPIVMTQWLQDLLDGKNPEIYEDYEDTEDTDYEE